MLRLAFFSLCFCSIGALQPPKNAAKVLFSEDEGPRIINGEQAKPGQFPWQAGIFVYQLVGGTFCGACIISDEWLLTAGHCLYGARSGYAVTGTMDPNNGLESTLAEGILHERYDPFSLENDIALVRISPPLKFDVNTTSISLASQPLEEDVDVTVSGWGATSDAVSELSDTLNFVNLRTISNEDCNQVYGIIGDGIVCAISDPGPVKSACSGDSGGPLIANSGSGPVHVGIVSFVSDNGCESGDPSGFTRTAYYRDWIRNNTGI